MSKSLKSTRNNIMLVVLEDSDICSRPIQKQMQMS
jgi:hypothetical protein